MSTPAPGAPGHGSGIVSVRRQVGDTLERDPETDEWMLRFEVICPDCGDDGGAFAAQPAAVQAVRGPYPSIGEARAAAAAHTGR
jgi:hypothetical protein